jgi:hypothetical protein
MALRKRVGNAQSLAVDTAGGTSYTTLANIVKEISGPNAQAAEIDMGLLGDVYETYQRGSVNPGEYKCTIAYDPEDTNTTILTASLGATFATLASTIPHWKVTYAASGSGDTDQNETFFGFVKGLDKKGEKNNMVIADLTIKISGNPFSG